MMRHSIKKSKDRKYNIDRQNLHYLQLGKRFFAVSHKDTLFFDKAPFSNKSKFNVCAGSTYLGYLPMLRVTVMMFRDIVESVMLLNEEDWR